MSDPWKLARTRFSGEAEYLRPILDEFLEAMRHVMNNTSYFPGIKDLSRWRKGASDLYENFRGYKSGFLTWAVPEHQRRFPNNRYIASPWTLRYLWDDYSTHVQQASQRTCPECGQGLLICTCDDDAPVDVDEWADTHGEQRMTMRQFEREEERARHEQGDQT